MVDPCALCGEMIKGSVPRIQMTNRILKFCNSEHKYAWMAKFRKAEGNAVPKDRLICKVEIFMVPIGGLEFTDPEAKIEIHALVQCVFTSMGFAKNVEKVTHRVMYRPKDGKFVTKDGKVFEALNIQFLYDQLEKIS